MALNLRTRHFLNLLCLGMIGGFRSRPTPTSMRWWDLRLKVYDPDLTEFVDRGGGPHCLTFELERDKE